MEVLHECVAGLDVHKDSVVGCVRTVSGDKTTREHRTFDATTDGLLALLEWLTTCRCELVAMEATGVYWMPVWRILSDGAFKLIVVNAAHIKLDSVISDIMGRNGRRMIEAMITGVRDPRKLAALADQRLKATPKQLYDALHGRLTDHHRFLLQLHLGQWDTLDATIKGVDREVATRVFRMDTEVTTDKANFSDLIDQLVTIPGVSGLSALTILSEIGTDMSRFATAGHLVAWAGMCPGQNESAGKRKRTRLRKGAPWLKTMLVQCAWAAKRKKDSYYKAQFFRLQSRRGPQKAICAVAASLLTAIYHMLKDGTIHQDLGSGYFDQRPPEIKVKRLVNQIAKLGFEVTLQPIAKAA